MIYITPERAVELEIFPTVEQARRAARNKSRCMVCGAPAWRIVETGLCFVCTTGTHDHSDDYELIKE